MRKYVFFIGLLVFSVCSFGDEGMWPLNALPKERIKDQYRVDLDDQWVEHVQKSSLRVSSGGSASFVSPKGLFLTNHHVGYSAIYALSNENRNLIENGFYAKTFEEELHCPNLFVDQLVSIRDVTEEITQKISPEMTLSEKEGARRSAIASLKEKAEKETGLHPEIVSLFRGARYHLYLYKRYDDIRLVMCPEESIASFGGDPENFEFPRHCLDMAFFRVYENDRPLDSDHYFQLSYEGPRLGEPLFVLGHPGRTSRILTSDHLILFRDVNYPLCVEHIEEELACLDRFEQGSSENKRIASKDKRSLQNALKVYKAYVKGLSGDIIPKKLQMEQELFKELSFEQQEPWREIKLALDAPRAYVKEFFFLEGMGSHHSKLFDWARCFVRMAEELRKPNGQRLKEYVNEEITTLKLSLLSEEPVYLEYEKERLINGLKRLSHYLGEEHPVVQSLKQKGDVEKIVSEIIEQTQLHKLEYRTQLFDDLEQVFESNDPLFLLARLIDPYAREVRKKEEEAFLPLQTECYEKITHILFDKYGDRLYPDATFTLRMSIGEMKGYQEGGEEVFPETNLEGLFVKAEANSYELPYQPPPCWKNQKNQLDVSVPFNFVFTNDIIGGNSGSPVINSEGRLVGLVFDGNRHSFTWSFFFDQTVGRAISVHPGIILHALKEVYHATPLVDELTK